MFKTIKNALKTPKIRNRLLYTLLLIVIFRFGCHVTVPGVDILELNSKFTDFDIIIINVAVNIKDVDTLQKIIKTTTGKTNCTKKI